MSRRTDAEILAPPDAGRPDDVWLNIEDGVLHLALKHVIIERGRYRPVLNPGDLAYRVTDTVPLLVSPADVLVTRPTALASQIALGAMVRGAVSALISVTQPEELATTLDGLKRGVSTVPAAVLAAARRVRRLSGRQHQILGCLASGLTRDRSIAAKVLTSTATVKRDVHQLGEEFAVQGRHELGALARDLGYSGALAPHLLDLVDAPV